MTPEFEAAVAAYLAERGSGRLRAAAAALSGRYRSGGTSAGIDFTAYLTVRLPATFAAVSHAMAELRRRCPDFAPASLLDAGSGPGTAAWAGADHWPGLADAALLDSDRDFLALAGSLARASPHAALRQARFLTGDIGGPLPEADLVVASYALAEVPKARRKMVISALWKAARRVLIVVEPGTPGGFATVREMRQTLLERGAVPVAPCTHGARCPMAGEDWCHFSVRLARRRAHLHAKRAQLPFEDEKFSYLVMASDGAASGGARILAPPQISKPGITFKLCTAEGLEWRHVARRDGAAYKDSRKKDWGGVL